MAENIFVLGPADDWLGAGEAEKRAEGLKGLDADAEGAPNNVVEPVVAVVVDVAVADGAFEVPKREVLEVAAGASAPEVADAGLANREAPIPCAEVPGAADGVPEENILELVANGLGLAKREAPVAGAEAGSDGLNADENMLVPVVFAAPDSVVGWRDPENLNLGENMLAPVVLTWGSF